MDQQSRGGGNDGVWSGWGGIIVFIVVMFILLDVGVGGDVGDGAGGVDGAEEGRDSEGVADVGEL